MPLDRTAPNLLKINAESKLRVCQESFRKSLALSLEAFTLGSFILCEGYLQFAVLPRVVCRVALYGVVSYDQYTMAQ